MTDTTTAITLTKLLPWAGNVRRTDADKGIAELAASIAAHGLLQSLVVRKDRRGKYAVVAGRRRLLALKSLAEAKAIDADRPIPCTIIDGDTDAVEISLAENFIREPMHPADEFEAFKVLTDSGTPLADVAARFGVSETVVKQRLKLANVSPLFIDAYRNGEMALQHVMAFTVTEDHAAQERVWSQLSDWQRNDPDKIRDALTENEVTADDRRVKFVTLATYEAAGGMIRRDLFSEGENGVFIDDIALLDKLVVEKLEETGAEVSKQGWNWVAIRSAFDHAEWDAHDRRYPEPADLSPEQNEERAALIAENDALAEIEELDEAQQARFEAINDRLDELENAEDVWSDETLAIAGAIVALTSRGSIDIRYGYVRPEDVPPETESQTDLATETSKPARPPLPFSLVENLTTHRSAALIATLMNRPDVALASVVHALAFPVFYGGSRENTPLQLSLRTMSLRDVDESPAAQAIGAAEEGWAERLPCNPEQLFAWCLAQDDETLRAMLAFCAARSINAVQSKSDHADCPRLAQASVLAEALQLDMAKWFTPTAENYFSKVSKATVIEAVRETIGTTAPAWNGMKKAELVVLAERKIVGTGWLPALLRQSVSDERQAGNIAA